jgi:hypothetical protein
MPQQPQQNGSTFTEDMNFAVGLFQTVVTGWAGTITPFVRRDFGCRYFSNVGWGWLLMAIYTLKLSEEHPVGPMIVMLCVVPMMWCLHNVVARIRSQRPDAQHSLYNGWPVLCDWFGGSEALAKRYWEPVLLAAAGMFLVGWNGPFGIYLLGGAICIAAESQAIAGERQRLVQATRDAMHEQRMLAEEMRNL